MRIQNTRSHITRQSVIFVGPAWFHIAGISSRQQHPSHRLLQFPYIARPPISRWQIAAQRFEHATIEFATFRTGGARHQQADKLFQFHRCLIDSFAQRRHDNDVGAQAIEEIVAEIAAAAQFRERAIGGSDHAPRKPLLLVAAERRVGALLQHLQQLDLDRHADFTDLVEK